MRGDDAATWEKGSTMDPYTAQKLLEYNQQELARIRGQRNWVRLFHRGERGRDR